MGLTVGHTLLFRVPKTMDRSGVCMGSLLNSAFQNLKFPQNAGVWKHTKQPDKISDKMSSGMQKFMALNILLGSEVLVDSNFVRIKCWSLTYHWTFTLLICCHFSSSTEDNDQVH